MSGKAVLDSSAIVALFFKEELSERVEEVVEKYSEYHTVSHAYTEVANAAWKRAKIFGEDVELVKQALESAVEFMDKICEVVSIRSILNSAFEMALEHGVTVYDALFVALAAKLKAKLVTTDAKLHKMLKGTELEKLVELVA